jgi:hypothetical protein
MDKRYQVFVSSTFADLVEERRAVLQTLMKMPCIPAGMELFPASDESQLTYIKRIIDNCDYYLLIIGGKYGSLTSDGISFTEKEYDYAVERGLHVIALLHQEPASIPLGKSEGDPAIRERLNAFRTKVSGNRLVQFWKSASDLPGLVAVSMQSAMTDHPAIGWVRADRAANEDVLADINEFRKQNDLLKAELKKHVPVLHIDNLAALDEQVQVAGSYKSGGDKNSHQTNKVVTWERLFAIIAPWLAETPNEETLKSDLGKAIFGNLASVKVSDVDMETIRVQFQVLGLVTVAQAQTRGGGVGLFWHATQKGLLLGLQLRAVRTAKT